MTKMHTDLSRAPLVVLLHNLRSAYNTGSIFRTADAMRIERLLLSGFTPDPAHPKLRKTALGAERSVPWSRTENVREELRLWRRKGFTIAALECAPTALPLHDVDGTQLPMLLIAGNEVDGVPENLLEECDVILEIKQYGMKQSLNVSVASGIAMHSLVQLHLTRDPQFI
ncbi:MAG: RNA methyltransferase [Bacteroidetes bacterium CG12_big_fil_rev_8_21_14_0_65_60_17]|nr:MAG: RNA methyltransferase [Bacteroidetes bacterium CG12_big_fil_rev_8_21_14_0_65_60_17]